VTIVERVTNPYSSTAWSEVVTCELDTQTVTFFCKYGRPRPGRAHRQWRGVPYEARVYGDLLEELPLPTVPFYGAYGAESTDQTWLVLGHLDQCRRLNKVNGVDMDAALQRSARWIGLFHAAAERAIGCRRFLRRYTRSYFRHWIDQTLALSRHAPEPVPWLSPLCAWTEGKLDLLLDSPTVIHGEYYPRNILVQNGAVYPVDWETSGVAAGEIDLASLVDGWPTSVVRCCENEYRAARWPHGGSGDFESRLSLAHLYFSFRWLGEPAAWPIQDDRASRRPFERLHSKAVELGLVDEELRVVGG
jgi:aminoglycoside phosphotransferase (APT) family kinase protein